MSDNGSGSSLLGKIAGYTEILAKDPNSTIFVPLCETYRQMGLLDDALEIAQKGVRRMPRFSPGYTVLGRIQAQRGDRAEACAAFEKALELDPDKLVPLKGLARLRYLEGDRESARALLERAAAVKPNDPGVKKMLSSLGAKPTDAPVPGAKAVPPSPTTSAPVAEPPRQPSPPASVKPVSPPETPAAAPAAVAASAPAMGGGRTGPKPGDPITTATIAEIYIRQGFLGRALKVYRDILAVDPHNQDVRMRLVRLKEQIEARDREGKVASAPEVPPETTAVAVEEEIPLRSVSASEAVSVQETVPSPSRPAEGAGFDSVEQTGSDIAEQAASTLSVDTPGAPRALEVLERWLDLIAVKRRKHVQ